jgi:hypothetical protein
MPYILIREKKDGTIEGIRFDAGILARLQITEDEWKAIPWEGANLRFREYLETGRG